MAQADGSTRLCMFAVGGVARVGMAHRKGVIDLTRAYAQGLAGKTPEAALAQALAHLPQTVEGFLRNRKTAVAAASKALAAVKKGGASAQFDGAPLLYEESQVRFLPPLAPKRIICMARNYSEHGDEFDKLYHKQKSSFNFFTFLKPHTAVSGPFDPIRVPASVKKLDYEIELGIVVGPGGRNIPKGKAMTHVAGYTIGNDMSDRAGIPPAKSSGRVDWVLMKARDGFAPLGPYLLLADSKVDPYKMRLKLWVNGKLRQNALAAEMIYKIDEQISRISQTMTLETGDVILTGSPAGNAAKYGQWLKPGDQVEGEVTGIGRQKFSIERGKAAYLTIP